MTLAKARLIFERLNRIWPNAHCELAHFNQFQLLIAVVLSAQATDISVNKALLPLLQSNPEFGPKDLVSMGEAQFYQVIRSINFAPTKAKNCFQIATLLLANFDGNVPTEREDLESLPGVGRKTANVVQNVLFGLPTMAVDTHVARVSQRLKVARTTNDRVVIEGDLMRKVPKHLIQNAHHQLIFHGRYICTARKPKCTECQLADLCPSAVL